MLLNAGVRFYQVANSIQGPTLKETTPTEVTRWLQRSLARKPPGPVRKLISKVDAHWSFLLEKCGSEIAFDDFHLCNALTKSPPPGGESAVLIDIHPKRQPWVLDVAYLQVLNSGDRKRPGHRNLIQRMATKRSEAELRSLEGSDLVAVGKIALGWMAARQWQPDLAEWQPDYRNAYEQFITEAVIARE